MWTPGAALHTDSTVVLDRRRKISYLLTSGSSTNSPSRHRIKEIDIDFEPGDLLVIIQHDINAALFAPEWSRNDASIISIRLSNPVRILCKLELIVARGDKNNPITPKEA
jgi:hypothetical protein